MEMKGDSTTTSSSSSSTNNYPPVNITLNSLNKDVTINEMLDSVFMIQEKINNNNNNNNNNNDNDNDNNNCTTTNTTQWNRRHKRKELDKFNTLHDGEEDTKLTAIQKCRLALPSFC